MLKLIRYIAEKVRKIKSGMVQKTHFLYELVGTVHKLSI